MKITIILDPNGTYVKTYKVYNTTVELLSALSEMLNNFRKINLQIQDDKVNEKWAFWVVTPEGHAVMYIIIGR